MSQKKPYTQKEKYLARKKSTNRADRLIRESKQKWKGKKRQERKRKQALEEILGCSEQEAIDEFNRNKRRVSSKYSTINKQSRDYKRIRRKRK